MTSAERLVWRIKGAMLDHERTVAIKPRKMWGSWRISSVSSAAAACLILGFMFGRVGHNPSQPPVGMPTGIASSDSHNSTLIHYTAPGQSSAPTQLIASNPKPKISVPITDEYGQVVAWQTFDNAEDAKSFTEDLHKTHAQQSAPALTSPPRLVDQQQF